jgi:hypothetical protein
MIIALAIFPFLMGGIVMWFVAHMVAPVGYTLSLSRGFVAVVLMACSGTIARHVLRPFIGEWCELAELGVSASVGMVILQLPFWRSLLAVVAYTIVVIAATIGVGVYAPRGQKANNQSVEPMGASRLAFASFEHEPTGTGRVPL